MTRSAIFINTYRRACTFTAVLAIAGYAHAASDIVLEAVSSTDQAGTVASIRPGQASSMPTKQQRVTKPLWTDLTPAQQQALKPLAGEWDKLEPPRKTKWLVIGNKYASMKPDEQQRLQERMREWVKLTPEQHRIARESYARAKKLNPDQKSAQWEQYQQLPEEQKQKLAADAAGKKRITTLPPPSQNKAKTVPPIKSAPRAVLERSVTPQIANQSSGEAAPQPATK